MDRIIEWALTIKDLDNLSDKALMLSAITVCWFLTTPNRFVRDKATKALVNLLRNRLNILLPLLKHFEGVNDLYILERIYAVAYSCSLLNKKDVVSLKGLAIYVYKFMFQNNPPTTHILIRDYARGIIEAALSQTSISKIDQSKIYPPYQSDWPEQIPTEDELRAKYNPDDFASPTAKDREFISIWVSVMGMGDFARYIIGTNSGGRSHYWSGKRIGNQQKSIKDFYREFQKTLSKRQKSIWDLYRLLMHEEVLDILKGKEEKNERFEFKREDLIKAFEASLSKVQRVKYEELIKPHLDDTQLDQDPKDYFDLSIAQRWIFNRVIELGYDPQKHNEFDDFVNRYDNSGRSEHKAERIGKKYQWIAYHEFMGLLADNFQFRNDHWGNKEGFYQGPWIPYMRDIDPTLLISDDVHIQKSISVSNWLSEYVNIVNKWYDAKPDKEWMKIRKDLPDPIKILNICDDRSKSWLLFNGFFDWDKPVPPEIDKFDVPRRNIWYMFKSYLVHNSDMDRLKNWGQQQRFMGRWMPESGDFYKIFLAEYPYSYAYDCIQDDDWRTDTKKKRELSISVLVTENNYLNEFTYDCSSNRNSTRISLPCAVIIKEMNLLHTYNDGRFYQDEKLACLPLKIFDESSPDCLLFNKELLSRYLIEHDYSIIWTFIGEKRILTMSGNSLGLLEMNGFYWFSGNEEIKGKYKTKFVEYLH